LAAFTQFDNLEIGDDFVCQGESHEGFHLVPTFISASAGVDVQKIQVGVCHDFQDMGVAADEQAAGRWIFTPYFPDPWVIFPGVAADVGHEHRHSLTFEMEVKGYFIANGCVVDIAKNTAQGFECLQLVEHPDVSEIAGVPYFVTIGEVMKNAFVQKGVGV
jgi:hypothetical protein